mgnify:CR=1 FL=1
MVDLNGLCTKLITNFSNTDFKFSKNIDVNKISFRTEVIHDSQINSEEENIKLVKSIHSEFPDIPVEEILYFKNDPPEPTEETYIEDQFLRMIVEFYYDGVSLKTSKAWEKIIKLYSELNNFDEILYKQKTPEDNVYSYYPYFEEDITNKFVEMEIFIFFKKFEEPVYNSIMKFFTENL